MGTSAIISAFDDITADGRLWAVRHKADKDNAGTGTYIRGVATPREGAEFLADKSNY